LQVEVGCHPIGDGFEILEVAGATGTAAGGPASTSMSKYKNLLPAPPSSNPMRTTFQGELNPNPTSKSMF